MTSPQRRRPTPAQRAVLERIRDGEVYHNRLSPRRSGILPATLAVLEAQQWIAYGEEVPVQGCLLVLTEAGRAALEGG
ncbi:hypothetical protein [Acrocarpospora catenulata]|uniref:hypothetical protein n=1 Tax=Acrocarpospora catenulata TaxID=2836182 RepID=UPI001BDB3290|nr:hypothetical protein [Acrocarpospora catenulata]